MIIKPDPIEEKEIVSVTAYGVFPCGENTPKPPKGSAGVDKQGQPRYTRILGDDWFTDSLDQAKSKALDWANRDQRDYIIYQSTSEFNPNTNTSCGWTCPEPAKEV